MAVWAKILTSLHDHPKAIEAGPQAMWIYVCMILHAKERDTSGFVHASFVHHSRHGRAPLRAVSRLIRVGLVRETAHGWQIDKYDEKQGKAASISEEREKKAAQKRKERAAKLANVASDTSQPVASLEQSREEQSRKEESANALSCAREANDLVPILADLEKTWPSLRCRDVDRPRRDSAIFDRRDDLPLDVARLAACYIAAHGFSNENIDGCPGLHRWMSEARWLEPLPKSKGAKPNLDASHGGRRDCAAELREKYPSLVAVADQLATDEIPAEQIVPYVLSRADIVASGRGEIDPASIAVAVAAKLEIEWDMAA